MCFFFLLKSVPLLHLNNFARFSLFGRQFVALDRPWYGQRECQVVFQFIELLRSYYHVKFRHKFTLVCFARLFFCTKSRLNFNC